MTITYIILGAIAILVVWLIWAYNSLVLARNRSDESWSDINVQLKRRHDLIPNVVETVKGYAAHEKGVFESVTNARSRAMGAKDPKSLGEAENALTNTLKTLFAVAEAYPDLKANANFLDLQRELADTENKIQAARRFYNSNVLVLNTKIDSFPTNIVAGAFSFGKKDFFEIEEVEKALPQVKF
ncbi:MAG: LemA family protein [Parcubacteria group bacterium GW2011_GWB1_52_7]|nr:MAG: LemA family protein [Parcubacteria group bacterium GW2011_GWA1_51_12]KKW29093.1 MAG: LemA family protein [Parcubacteria group bacterium GW2011_GWB1_52_7]